MLVKNKRSPFPRKQFERRRVTGLKGGCGTVTIYVAKQQHKDLQIYEYGYIVLPPGASIGLHYHNDDEESYEVIQGVIEYQGEYDVCDILDSFSGRRTCRKGECHRVFNFGTLEAIIRFEKVR